MNRSVTVPTRLTTIASPRNGPPAEIGAADGIETLYVHPRASIIKFSTASSGSRPSSSSGSPRSFPNHQSTGTLPWASPTERTLAAGPLEIYRVPGSVSFLHSGALLHAILPRSQCWCVDGVSKFAFRVLPDTYYRIELPGETPEDLEKVEEMKGVLGKVLFYERTPCPFARTFEVVLPEEGKERKRDRRKSTGPAKKWKLDRVHSWRPEDGLRRGGDEVEEEESSGSLESSDAEVGAGAGQGESSHSSEVEVLQVRTSIATLPRPTNMMAMRSITAPVKVSHPSTPPSRTRTHGVVGTFESLGTTTTPPRASSGLRTFQSMPIAMPPSPPDSSAGLEATEITLLQPTLSVNEIDGGENEVEIEELQETDAEAGGEAGFAVPASPDPEPILNDEVVEPRMLEQSPQQRLPMLDDGGRDEEPTTSSDPPQEPDPPLQPPADRPLVPIKPFTTLTAAFPPTDPFAAIQARILARRSIGDTPPRPSPPPRSTSTTSISTTATISRRASPTERQQAALTTALLHRAYSALLGPPAALIAIMLRIAARFANGALGSSFVIASPDGGRKSVPGSFDLEDVDGDWGQGEAGEEREDEEDDFGVPLRSPVRLAARPRETRKWEGD